MSKHKIIGLALCGLMLTSCENGGENLAYALNKYLDMWDSANNNNL